MWPVSAPGGKRPASARSGAGLGPTGASLAEVTGEAGKPFFVFCFSQAGNKTHRSLKPTHSSLLGRASRAPARRLSVGTKGGQVSPAGSVGSGRSPPGTLAPAPTFAERKEAYETEKRRTFTVRFTEEQFRRIQEQADKAMMTPSNYIRAAALRKKLQVILDGKAVAKELNAIGNNLNQLTTLAHMGRVAGGQSGRRPSGFGQALSPLL